MKDLIKTELKTQIKSGVSVIMSGVESLTITNQSHLVNAARFTKEIKITGDLIEDERKKLVNPRNAEVKEINAFFKQYSTMLDTAEATLKKAILAYQNEQERIRIEAQRKADEEARKEREKIEAAARVQREKEEAALRKAEEERQAQIEAERRAAEETDAAKRRLLEAEAAERRKEADKAMRMARDAAANAEAKENVATTVVAQVVESNYAKPNGSYSVKVYSGEIIDLKAFVKYCLDNNQLGFLSVEIGKVNKVLQATTGTMTMPGIRVIEKEDLRMRKN